MMSTQTDDRLYERRRQAEARARRFNEQYDCTECGNRTLSAEGNTLVCHTCGAVHDHNSNRMHAKAEAPIRIVRGPNMKRTIRLMAYGDAIGTH